MRNDGCCVLRVLVRWTTPSPAQRVCASSTRSRRSVAMSTAELAAQRRGAPHTMQRTSTSRAVATMMTPLPLPGSPLHRSWRVRITPDCPLQAQPCHIALATFSVQTIFLPFRIAIFQSLPIRSSTRTIYFNSFKHKNKQTIYICLLKFHYLHFYTFNILWTLVHGAFCWLSLSKF